MLMWNDDASNAGHGHFGREPSTPRATSSTLRRRHRSFAAFLLTLSWLAPTMAEAQSDSFDVTVNPDLTDSQRQVSAQGSAGLAAATMQLRSLEFLTDSLRRSERERRRQGEELEGNARSKGLQSPIAGLAASWLSVGAALGAADAETGAEFDRFNVFSNLDYRFGDREQTANAPGNDLSMLGITVGADYRLNPDLVIGATLGYVANDTEFTTGNGRLKLDSYSLSGLMAWYVWRNLYIDGLARMAIDDFDARRRLAGGGTATGQTDGFEYSLSASSGYEFYHGALNYGPLVRVTYTNISIDGYRERGGTNSLGYEDQDIESLRTAVGGDAAYVINTGFGVVVPQAAVEWVHEFEDDPRLIVAQPATGGARFGIPTDPRDSDFYRVALGVTGVLTRGRNIFFRYEADLSRANQDNHTVTLGARLEL